MDDTLQELEMELKRLRPVRPSMALQRRVEASLETVATPAPYRSATAWRSWKWAGWTLAAAAAVVVGLVLARRPAAPVIPDAVPTASGTIAATAPAASAESLRPVAAVSVLYDLRDDGRVADSTDKSARQVRYRYIDTYTFRDRSNKASLKWSVPRDEVRVIPASLN